MGHMELLALLSLILTHQLMVTHRHRLVVSTPFCIQEIPGSNLGLETSCPDSFSDGFSQLLQPTASIDRKLDHSCFLPCSFQSIIHQ